MVSPDRREQESVPLPFPGTDRPGEQGPCGGLCSEIMRFGPQRVEDGPRLTGA